MSGCYEQALQLSFQKDIEKKIAEAEKSRADQTSDALHYTKLLDQLVQEVTEGYEEKVMAAAREGLRSADLYVFDGGDTLAETDQALLFLVKGPRRYGQDFFLRLGVLPFPARVYQIVKPFEFRASYNPEANENVLSLTW